MIKQQFDVDSYWKVVIFYNVDYDLLKPIYKELLSIGFSHKSIDEAIDLLYSGEAKAVTFSNTLSYNSVILFGKHNNKYDYINSLVHEAEHVKQAMLKAYRVVDEGEPPAYTMGFLIENMYKVFQNFLCSKHR